MFSLFFNNHPLFKAVIEAFKARLELVKRVYEQELAKIDDAHVEEMDRLHEITQSKKEVLANDLVSKHFKELI